MSATNASDRTRALPPLPGGRRFALLTTSCWPSLWRCWPRSAGGPGATSRWPSPAVHALNLNLFYGFSEGIVPNMAVPRSLTVVDAAVVLPALNVVAWHARVLLVHTRLSRERSGAEISK